MAKAKEDEVKPVEAKSAEPVAKLAEPVASKPAPEWIRCKVNVPNCHVGMIECRIAGNTPIGNRHAAACLAAAEVRGIALNQSGVPQFASAPEVEYLEN